MIPANANGAMMTTTMAAAPESEFMHLNIPLFFGRFAISYFQEGSCIEYFINRRASDAIVSSALILCYNSHKKDLHVSRFYPELYTQSASKYLSAVCFYLLIHHCGSIFSLDYTCHISLETVQKISDRFYRKLRDFNFMVSKYHRAGDAVELVSDFMLSTVDTSEIKKHHFHVGEIPFMK